jgi:hypothetical protein
MPGSSPLCESLKRRPLLPLAGDGPLADARAPWPLCRVRLVAGGRAACRAAVPHVQCVGRSMVFRCRWMGDQRGRLLQEPRHHPRRRSRCRPRPRPRPRPRHNPRPTRALRRCPRRRPRRHHRCPAAAHGHAAALAATALAAGALAAVLVATLPADAAASLSAAALSATAPTAALAAAALAAVLAARRVPRMPSGHASLRMPLHVPQQAVLATTLPADAAASLSAAALSATAACAAAALAAVLAARRVPRMPSGHASLRMPLHVLQQAKVRDAMPVVQLHEALQGDTHDPHCRAAPMAAPCPNPPPLADRHLAVHLPPRRANACRVRLMHCSRIPRAPYAPWPPLLPLHPEIHLQRSPFEDVVV